mmetsp:Transcript_10577/g.22325  ORF Transcript_10577/g.22325 Transcript_10577/m.22325 type:complete len:185 (+) Transcript_10577:169-723(+)
MVTIFQWFCQQELLDMSGFSQRFPFLLVPSPKSSDERGQQQRQAATQMFPAEVLENLFVGGQAEASGEVVALLGITHILCLLENKVERPADLPASVTWRSLMLADAEHADITTTFQPAAFLFESAQHAGGKMLVHCKHGKSRSVAAVVALLMRVRKWPLDRAHRQVTACRRGVCINPGPHLAWI